MKKFINLILVILIALAVVIPDYTKAASPYPIRYWKRFRKELQDYLVNYRAPLGSGNTCIRTAQMPDGRSDCLSIGKIMRIMAQLDADDYWAKTDPTARREYLWYDTEQPYVMKKVVMYFEQNLNLETRIYGANLPREKVDMYVDTTFSDTAKSFIALAKLAGRTLNIYDLGDNDIRALAFDSKNVGDWLTHIYEYTLKPKSEIPHYDLEKIYNADRLKQFQTWIDYPEWRQEEVDAMWPVVAKDMNVIDEARKTGTSPVYAKKKQDSMQFALLTLGIVGIEAKAGGMILRKAASGPSPSYVLKGYIGKLNYEISWKRLPFIFERSKLPTILGPDPIMSPEFMIDYALREFDNGANYLYQYGRRYNPTFITEKNLADIVRNRSFVASRKVIQEMAESDLITSGWVSPLGDIFVADELYIADINGQVFNGRVVSLSQMIERTRRQTQNFGYAEEYRYINEMINNTFTRLLVTKESMASEIDFLVGIQIGHTFKGYTTSLADRLTQLHPDIFVNRGAAGEHLYRQMLAGTRYSYLDDLITKTEGGLTFSQALDKKLGECQTLTRQFQAAPASQRGSLAIQIALKNREIKNFILNP